MATIFEELSTLLKHLSPTEQQSVLDYARTLASSKPTTHALLPTGTPGSAILRFRVSDEGGEAMEQALEDCEQIEPDEQ